MSIKLSKPALFAVAVIVQMAIVIGLIVFNQSLLIRGTQVLLPVHPYDPTDPLRGDYITLTYDISRINVNLADDENKLTEGSTVYVVLSKTGDHWEATGVKISKPAKGQLFIRGNVNYVDYDYSSTDWSNSQNAERKVYITYGIENYFVPEGTGAGLVSQISAKQALARVVVDGDGNSVLASIVFGADVPKNPPAIETPAIESIPIPASANNANETDQNGGNITGTGVALQTPSGSKSVTLTKPNGGEIICLGQKTEIAWTSNGLDSVGLRLEKEQMDGSSYYYIGFDGVKATSDESGTPGAGSVYWTPKDIPAGDTYKLEIMGLGSDSSISDKSDSVFSIANCNQ